MWLTLGASLFWARPASADLVLFDKDGWTFFTDGRINSFYSLGYGDAFPTPTPNPTPPIVDPNGVEIPAPTHSIVGDGQQIFNAGFANDQGLQGKFLASRVRSGFLGSIIAFGMKREVTETTAIKSYVSLWQTAQTNLRTRIADTIASDLPAGKNQFKSFDVREGWLAFEGRAGTLIAGRQNGILGGMSTEIDFLYGHNFGLGLPCVEPYFPACGHIGSGALGPGNGSAFTYTTPSLGGLRLKAGFYDPVRLLGAWERTPYPRPEGALMFERRPSASVMFKLQVEGMYQYMAQIGERRTDRVWGVAGGARLEAGPLRLGVSGFRGKGLGAYVALQNAASTFEPASRNFRYFTGMYAQLALVFGREQLSAGAGRVIADQLDADKVDFGKSNLKSQSGISGAFYHRVTDNFVLGIDYLLFHTEWWGAPNSTNMIDPSTNNPVAIALPGFLKGEKQTVHFVNVGATFHW